MDTWIEDRIKALREDRVSGATALTRKAADLLQEVAQQAPQALQTTAVEIVQAQPAMASIWNMANEVLLAYDRSVPSSAPSQQAAAAAAAFSQAISTRSLQLAEHALPWIHEGWRIFTHSASSGVEAALFRAGVAGKHFWVTCTESRPLYEGREMAWRLARAGLDVTLVTDGLAPFLVASPGIVLIGADAVSASGVVNKAGTLALALAARQAGVHFVVLCNSQKCIPALAHPQVYLDPREGGELFLPDVTKDEDLPLSLHPLNIYFDVTPLELVNGVITEQGWQTAAELVALQEERDVHLALRNLRMEAKESNLG